MNYRIRPFTPDDYNVMVTLVNSIYPNRDDTPESWRQRDEKRPSQCRWQHFVAEVDGSIVGQGSYWQNIWSYHPQKFQITVEVDERYRRRGLGQALYHRLLESLYPFTPTELHSRTREDLLDSVKFLARRGFRESDRQWESHLDPAPIDLSPYNDLERNLSREGIEIHTLQQLRDVDPHWAHKIYELDWIASQDAPSTETLTRPPFEDYASNVLQSPHLRPDGWFVAVRGDVYVGTSNLWTSPNGSDFLHTGFTGVHPNFRRRGIALALKVRAVAYAQAHGNPTIRTYNNYRNRSMLSINERLGFVKQPPWITFSKELDGQAEAATLQAANRTT